MISPELPPAPCGTTSVMSATVVECDDQALVVLLDDGTRRRLEDPASLGAGTARRGQRIQLHLEQGRVVAAGLVAVGLEVHPAR